MRQWIPWHYPVKKAYALFFYDGVLRVCFDKALEELQKAFKNIATVTEEKGKNLAGETRPVICIAPKSHINIVLRLELK